MLVQYGEIHMHNTRIRWGFKSKNQLPLFLVWREYLFDEEVLYAEVVFNSQNWIGL